MLEDRERRYHLGYAKLESEGMLLASLRDALLESWRPGTSIARYGRRWLLTVPREADGLIFGRIGFVSEDVLSTLRFDRETLDFVHGEAPSGVVVPFVVRIQDGLIVYQLRPGIVRETTFTGALTEMLNTSESHRWTVRSVVEEQEFEAWRSTHPEIKAFKFKVERPNPDYHGNDWLETAVEGMNLEVLDLAGRARDGASVNMEAEPMQEALDHVARDYGTAKIVGQGPDEIESMWVKIKGRIAEVATKRVRREVGGEEARDEMLVSVLAEAPDNPIVSDLNAEGDGG